MIRIGCTQVRQPKIRSHEHRGPKIGSPQVRGPQIRSGKIRIAQVSALQVRASEVAVREIRIGQIDPGQMGAYGLQECICADRLAVPDRSKEPVRIEIFEIRVPAWMKEDPDGCVLQRSDRAIKLQ